MKNDKKQEEGGLCPHAAHLGLLTWRFPKVALHPPTEAGAQAPILGVWPGRGTSSGRPEFSPTSAVKALVSSKGGVLELSGTMLVFIQVFPGQGRGLVGKGLGEGLG